MSQTLAPKNVADRRSFLTLAVACGGNRSNLRKRSSLLDKQSRHERH